MPPHDLHADQLESIQRLLVDPLRDAVRAEIQAGNERLGRSIDQLSVRLAAHVEAQSLAVTTLERRVGGVERQVHSLRRFRTRLLAAYSALTLLAGAAWTIFRDRLAQLFSAPRP